MNMLKDLWANWKQMKSPVFLPGQPMPLTPPRLQQEEFSQVENHDARVHQLYRRVIDTNNALVVRNYGSSVVDESQPELPGMTAAEFTELHELGFGIPVIDDDVAAAQRSRRMLLKQQQLELPLVRAVPIK